MLPVCSTATTAASSSPHYPQIISHAGLRGNLRLGKAVGWRGIVEDRFFLGITHRLHSQQVSFKTQVTNVIYSHVTGRPGVLDCLELKDQDRLYSNKWGDSMENVINTYPSLSKDISYVNKACKDMLVPVSDQISSLPSEKVVPQTILPLHSTMDVASTTPITLSGPLGDASLTNFRSNVENFFSAVSGWIDASVGEGYLFFKNTFDAITAPLSHSFQSASESINNGVSGLFSSADRSAELVGNRFTGFSVDLKDSLSGVGAVSIDVLRRTIITLEEYLASGGSLILHYYGSAKEVFPPEVRDVLNLAESRTSDFFSPVVAAFQQVYAAIELLEKNIGLDPKDPLVPLAFFLGSSAILGVSYWVLVYGGYSGDLSPQSTLALLKEEKNVALIDIRPEDLRARDGVPDLRRGARVKYASIVLPEIDGTVRKLMKSERDLFDMLVAAVIRNLKVVQDRSKIIVLDSDGTRSKSIARSLRKLGVKKPYLVQGGFQSWVKNGLRIKELKPETTFTVLNEEAEAILEDIRPTPVQIVGYALGFVAASYALSEWEKTLQFVGVIGLGQTIYRRIAAYEDSEDFRQDVRLLLGPFKVGAVAFSWAAGIFEPNRIGLPTSPSSTDVQSRVQQAAAKHESQPSDSEVAQELSQDLSVSANEIAGPSES